jgi:hypothetical protein
VPPGGAPDCGGLLVVVLPAVGAAVASGAHAAHRVTSAQGRDGGSGTETPRNEPPGSRPAAVRFPELRAWSTTSPEFDRAVDHRRLQSRDLVARGAEIGVLKWIRDC